MKFTVAVAALAAGAQAAYPAVSNVTYTTEVVSVYTTFCPAATQITYGSKTYTVTEATTLTISDCPCTISKPVLTTSSVKCSTCSSAATSAASVPVYPTGNNGTAAVTPKPTGGSIPTTVKTSAVASTSAAGSSSAPSAVPTGAAGKVAAFSGAGLAAIVGVAAFL